MPQYLKKCSIAALYIHTAKDARICNWSHADAIKAPVTRYRITTRATPNFTILWGR